jgi:hypothetical protein
MVRIVTRKIQLLCVVFLILGVAADGWSRQTQLSGIGGYGHITGEDVRSQFAPTVGASLNLRLIGPEIKIDYESVPWDRGGTLHLIGAGWFIQSEPKPTRPFFQIGWVFAIEPDARFVSANKFMGLAASAGLTRSLGSRFFIRPELRWKMIGPGPIMLTMPVVSAGFSF